MAKTRKLDLPRTVVWKNQRYGPGKGVEVPEDFPADIAERMAVAGRSRVRTAVNIQSPPGASGSEEELTEENQQLNEDGTPKTSAGTQDQYTKDQLEEMDKATLDQMAQQRGLTVKGTGKDGAILKDDLVKALASK